MRVLVVNAGSSSLKLRALDHDDALLASTDTIDVGSFVAGLEGIEAVGHRVVHGGPQFTGPVRIDEEVREALERLVPLAPLHQAASLRGIAETGTALPGVPAVACFDTAFHANMPPAAATYALPRAWIERWGLRRYGFHGLSHAWAATRGAALAGADLADLRVVTCHLGAGASCCALLGGRSVDTTMGFTPLDGLVMATRCGTVDPGLVVWLVDTAGLSASEVSDSLERASGLAGLAGGTGDAREVLAAAEGGDDRARLALDVWAHRLRSEIAAMAAAAGGLDLLVFTGGIGEHQPSMRAAACDNLGWLGVQLDPALNALASADAVVSQERARVVVAVVTAREDVAIARQVRSLLQR
jgi:acetate kinase